MKKSMIVACLLATLSAMPACAGAFAPTAELTVNQMPRVTVPAVQTDDDILTPLPGDSALPQVEKSTAPPPAKLLGLTASDRITPATDMPPQPHSITEEQPRTMEAYGPAAPVLQPALEKVSYRPGTAIPFPPSAEEWSARMPLIAKAAAPAKTAVTTRLEKTEEQTPAQRPSRHKVTRTASINDDKEDNQYRPRHIVVRQEGEASGNCRGYTRNLGGGRLANGTACADSNGVWRVADEHLVTRMRVARTYHVNRPTYGPTFGQAASVARLGLTIGNFWHFR